MRTRKGGGAKDPKNTWAEVGHNDASRNGEPFAALIQSRRFLPNPVMRICTEELKVLTTARFVRQEFGWRKHQRVLGLRYDERKRWGRLLMTDCDAVMPLVTAGVTQPEVQAWWARQPFDLAISSERGNCDLCFLKGRDNLVQTIRERPELADWWMEQEARVAGMRDTASGKADATFRRGVSFRDLVAEARRPPDGTLFDRDQPGDWLECNCTD